MRIPSDAIISREKLTKYLLVWQPENDKSKFLAFAGFTQDNPDALEDALRRLIADNDAVFDRTDRYGDFYQVKGELKNNDTQSVHVVTIWIMRTEEDGIYRFVTLVPGRKSDDAT